MTSIEIDEIDDPFISRYAERVADETEVLWRADFARYVELEDRAFDQDASLLPQAHRIWDRWATDPQVGPRWDELTEIHRAWITQPEAMRRAEQVTMPSGLRPPGMDDTRWASHMQAREMAGQGIWPGFENPHSMSATERHEPMTDTTPAHIMDSATESDTERHLRADFEAARQAYGTDPDEYDPAGELEARNYQARWFNHDDHRYVDEWCKIYDAEELWRRDPDAATAQLADTDTAPLTRRHLEHGRDLSRGIYQRNVVEVEHVRDEPSVEAARNNPEKPVPNFGPSVKARTSSLAGYRTGSALAGHHTGSALTAAMERETEGIER